MLTINDSINRNFGHFVNNFNSVINSHVPQKLAIRKEKKIKAKPLLTFAILRTIKIKNKMYKSLIHKPKDAVNKE